MASKVLSINESGDSANLITVECHITAGLPNVIIVGVANKAVDEAKERLRAAFHASKIEFPKKRITINLAPADLPKDSSCFDLAMATALMQAAKLIPETDTKRILLGELGLDGQLRAIRGVVGKLLAAKSKDINTFYIPKENLSQAKLVPGIKVIGLDNLRDFYLDQTAAVNAPIIETKSGLLDSQLQTDNESIDMADISGQQRAKRVLEIAAAGGHNVLFNGPPGTGKSMLAKALAGILPPMSLDEILEVTHLHSLASNNFDRIVTARPFRSPHHSASGIAVIGGGQQAKPGEISLAHKGVLFMDELPEYNRSTIEALRQPLEDRVITIARAKQSTTYPAEFMLVATSNPCPCGFYGTTKTCVCPPHTIAQYQRKLSGPIIDRIDLYAEVDNVEHASLLQKSTTNESSKVIRQRVETARDFQIRRNKSKKLNSGLSNKELKQFAKMNEAAVELLNQAAEKLSISARSYMKLVKVARTIADLDQSTQIDQAHISEAIQYRRLTTA